MTSKQNFRDGKSGGCLLLERVSEREKDLFIDLESLWMHRTPGEFVFISQDPVSHEVGHSHWPDRLTDVLCWLHQFGGVRVDSFHAASGWLVLPRLMEIEKGLSVSRETRKRETEERKGEKLERDRAREKVKMDDIFRVKPSLCSSVPSN